MILVGTGHRPNRLGSEWDHGGPVSMAVYRACVAQLEIYKPELCISGFAAGFDLLLAQAAIDSGYNVIAALPFDGQADRWSADTKHLYYDLLGDPQVTKVIVSPGPYESWKLGRRDYWMVEQMKDADDVLLSCWCGDPKSGTGKTRAFALKHGKKVINIWNDEWFRKETNG